MVYHSSSPIASDTDRGTQGVASRVTNAMNNLLIEPYMKEEVVMVLKKMAPLKSPGLDGLNPSFY